MSENVALLMRFYHRPARAASDAVDRGSPGFALASVALIALLWRLSGPSPFPSPASLAALAAIFLVLTPVSIAIVAAWDSLGSAGVVLRREYVSMAVCGMMAWSAAHLPFALLRLILPLPALGLAAHVAFVILYAICLRTALGVSAGHAAVALLAGWTTAAGCLMLWPLVGGFSYFLLSPWILYLLYRYYSPDVRSLGDALESRRSFRRQLEASMVNPHDADAHYQLGLIYLQRRQYTEAEASFQRAVRIQPGEAESRLQLGRTLRALGRQEEALPQFQAALQLNASVSSQEGWRDTGATLLELGRGEEAGEALGRYTQHRPYDPEGLFLHGKALRAAGRTDESREAFRQAIEAAQTAPAYRRGLLRKWASQAKAELKTLE